MKISHKRHVEDKKVGFIICASVLIAAAFLTVFSLSVSPALSHARHVPEFLSSDAMLIFYFVATLVETVGILVIVLTDSKPWHRTHPKAHMFLLMLILGASLLFYLVLPGMRFQEQAIWALWYYPFAFALLLYIFIAFPWMRSRKRHAIPIFGGNLSKLNTITISGR